MGNSRIWGTIVVIFFFILILSLLILDLDGTYENQTVLLIMNILFTGVAPIIVTVIAAGAYLQSDRTGALLMGCGMLVFGMGSITAGILRFLPDSVNVTITVYNTCALLGGGCHLWASQLTRNTRKSPAISKKIGLALAVSAVLAIVAGLTAAAIQGMTPVFFDEHGSTRIRDIVLWSAIVLYFSASMAVSGKYRELKSHHLYWYYLSLLMIAMGLFGVSLAKGMGTLLGWAGRAAQYTGAGFAWLAMANIWRRAKKEGVSIADVMGDFFWQTVRFPYNTGRTHTGSIGIDADTCAEPGDTLIHSESLLQDIIEGIVNPVFLKDCQSRFIMCNSALADTMGQPIHRILGKTKMELYEDKDKARQLMENDRRVLQSGTVQNFEESIPSPSGERTFLTTKTPWRDSQGRVIGIIGVAQDITERKAMETALKQQAEDLREKNKLITDFFINISHEFKTPIAVLSMGIELMENSAKEQPDIARHLGIMQLNAYRLSRLVSNLLDITKLDAGFMEPNWEHVDIVHILSDLVKSTEYYVNQKDLTLAFACNAEEKYMSIDGFILERIILNLLSNAIKHTRAGGSIHVGCLVSEDTVRISVADTGEGIPKDKQQIIFNRFMQVDTSLTRASDGCGIGLALTKSLVELLKGTISFESTHGEGTEFTVELPVLPMEIQPQCIVERGMGLHKRIQMEFSDLDFNFS